MTTDFRLPQELLDIVLNIHLGTVTLQQAVKLRPVSRNFCDTVDRLILKQNHFFDDRKAYPPPKHRKLYARFWYYDQHHYGIGDICSFEIASRLIESEWNNDSFVHPQFRQAMDQIETIVRQASPPGSEESLKTFKPRLYDLLARACNMDTNPEPCQLNCWNFTTSAVRKQNKGYNRPYFKRTKVSKEEEEQILLRSEALAIAAAACDTEIFQKLMRERNPPNVEKRKFWLSQKNLDEYNGPTFTRYRGSPLENAAMCGRIENLRVFLHCIEKNANIFTYARHVKSALLRACWCGHTSAAQLLVNFMSKHDLMEPDFLLADAFHLATSRGRVEVAKILEPFTTRNLLLRGLQYFNGLLLNAMPLCGNLTVLRYLYDWRARMAPALTEETNGYWFSAIKGAISHGRRQAISFLIEKGYDIDCADLNRDWFWPVYWDDIETLELLESYGVRLYEEGFATLAPASSRRCFKAVEYLLDRYPQYLEDGQAQDAVAMTYDHNDLAMTHLLLEHGTDVRGDKGSYAVFTATKAGNLDLLKLLLDRGASPNMRYTYHKPETVKLYPPLERVEYRPIDVALHRIEVEHIYPYGGKDFEAVFRMLQNHAMNR